MKTLSNITIGCVVVHNRSTGNILGKVTMVMKLLKVIYPLKISRLFSFDRICHLLAVHYSKVN